MSDSFDQEDQPGVPRDGEELLIRQRPPTRQQARQIQEVGLEQANQSEDEEEDASQASSSYVSEAEGEGRPDLEFVCLDSDEFCRVYFTRIERGVRVPAVCGSVRPCRHAGHTAKSDKAGSVAPPGYYHSFPNTKRPYVGVRDGRLDVVARGYSKEEVEAARKREDATLTELQRALSTRDTVDTTSEVTTLLQGIQEAPVPTDAVERNDKEGSEKEEEDEYRTDLREDLRRLVANMESTLDREMSGVRQVHFTGANPEPPTETTPRRSTTVPPSPSCLRDSSQDTPRTRPSNTSQEEETPLSRPNDSNFYVGFADRSDPGKFIRVFASIDGCIGFLNTAGPQAGYREFPSLEEAETYMTREIRRWTARNAEMNRERLNVPEKVTGAHRKQWYGILLRDNGLPLVLSNHQAVLDLQDNGEVLTCTPFSSQDAAEAWRRGMLDHTRDTPDYQGTAHREPGERQASVPEQQSGGRNARQVARGLQQPTTGGNQGRDLWYGLEAPDTLVRYIRNRWEEVEQLVQRLGVVLRQVFDSREEAEVWLKAYQSQSPQDLSPLPPPRRNDGSHVDPSTVSAYDESLRQWMGKDVSTGDQDRIQGILYTDEEKMHAALCPPGLTPGDQRDFIERSMDVLSLPGMYVAGTSDDDGGDTAGEDLAHAILDRMNGTASDGGKGGHNATWQTKRAHALGRVKDSQSLGKIVVDVRKAWKEAILAQKSRWRLFLAKRGYTYVYIEAYCRDGLLAVLIQRTYEFYSQLLTTARDLLYSESAAQLVWKGSRAEAMIKHHAEKLRQTRYFAGDYQSHILRSYVYLRDAEDKEYRHASMTDKLWDRFHQLSQKISLGEGNQDDDDEKPSASIPEPKCNHCKNKGHLRQTCPGKDLRPSHAKKALKDTTNKVGKNRQVLMCQEIKSLLEDRGDDEAEAVITEVRAKYFK